MKHIVLLACISLMICASESPISDANNSDATEAAYHKAIDNLFARAQESFTAKEDIITADWLACDEMKKVKNVISDLSIILGFDVYAKKDVTKKLQDHLDTKIRAGIDKIFENDEVRIDSLRQFLYLSETVCKLSDGDDCEYMMRGIKDDSFPLRQHAKTKQKMRQQVKKEDMRRLCKIVELGAQPR